MCPECDITHASDVCRREAALAEIEAAIENIRKSSQPTTISIQSTSTTTWSGTTTNIPLSSSPSVITYSVNGSSTSEVAQVLASMRDTIKAMDTKKEGPHLLTTPLRVAILSLVQAATISFPERLTSSAARVARFCSMRARSSVLFASSCASRSWSSLMRVWRLLETTLIRSIRRR